MKFEDVLQEMLNGIEAPDEISPENIALMLKAETSKKSKAVIEFTPRKIDAHAQRRTIISRTVITAVCACAVLAVGIYAYRDMLNPPPLDGQPTKYESIDALGAYDTYEKLYNTYTGILMEKSETDYRDDITADYAQAPESGPFNPDKIKSDGQNIYGISDGNFYVISKSDMQTESVIKTAGSKPLEMHIEGNSLILVSEDVSGGAGNEPIVSTEESVYSEAVAGEPDVPDDGTHIQEPEDSYDSYLTERRNDVCVDVYDISDGAGIRYISGYRQNGSYVSSRINGGMLYLVTCYSDYREEKPLDTQSTELDSFVPAYYVNNGEKKFVAAGDIMVPVNPTSTDYAVVSATDINGYGGLVSIKAVLGYGRSVYCSGETVYMVNAVNRNGGECSEIIKFSLSGGNIEYQAGGLVEGSLISRASMNEHNGSFRIATRVGDAVSVYVLEDNGMILEAVSSLGQIPGGVDEVKFEGDYAFLWDGGEEPMMILDLSGTSPIQVQSFAETSGWLYNFSDGMLLGFGAAYDESGVISNLSIASYDEENGLKLKSAEFAEDLEGVDSPALYDKRALLIDSENSLIGIPVSSKSPFGVKNRYYVYKYDIEPGFEALGFIEYNDLDGGSFERAFVTDGILYVVGGERVVSARISDLNVIDAIKIEW